MKVQSEFLMLSPCAPKVREGQNIYQLGYFLRSELNGLSSMLMPRVLDGREKGVPDVLLFYFRDQAEKQVQTLKTALEKFGTVTLHSPGESKEEEK